MIFETLSLKLRINHNFMMSLSGFEPYELKLLSRDTVGGTALSLTEMPQSGDIVIITAYPPDRSCPLFVFRMSGEWKAEQEEENIFILQP